MNSSPKRNTHPVSAGNILAVTAVATLFIWVAVCFCSLLPIVLFMSLLFNALLLGSGLFSALAQEREKRTIDALRLTQLTSLDILRYKSVGEFKAWRSVNAVFLALAAGAALYTGSPLTWALAGAGALACGGLLSIALALAVSTRCETTSSAVVTGWITKGVWLAGLPILDYVVEAVLVLGKELTFFSYLDPAWVYGAVVNGLIFETGAGALLSILAGAAASVGVAWALVWQSSKLIDDSFETAATLDDRNRHSAYGRRFAFGWHNNPFMVRELAWQMRTGAGAWPGYAVFITLFLAPFFYGLAQQNKVQERKPVKVVRQSVTATTPAPALPSDSQQTSPGIVSGGCHTPTAKPQPRYHGHLCVSQLMGLPVPTQGPRFDYKQKWIDQSDWADKQIIVRDDGKAVAVSEREAHSIKNYQTSDSTSRKIGRTHLQSELDRGLLTGLFLTLLYLFVRGGAFMSGAVTGEKERRAWDQIALTGATPDNYLSGKLAGVLYYPMKQLMWTSPILLLFGVYGGISLMEVLLIVPMLFVSFLAAANIGLLSSTTHPTSHHAQGQALLTAAAILLAPLMSGGWLVAGGFAFILLGRTALSGVERSFAALCTALWVALVGAAASPVAAVMEACDYQGFGSYNLPYSEVPAPVTILIGTLTMAVVAWGAYRLAVRSLNQGGSVKA